MTTAPLRIGIGRTGNAARSLHLPARKHIERHGGRRCRSRRGAPEPRTPTLELTTFEDVAALMRAALAESSRLHTAETHGSWHLRAAAGAHVIAKSRSRLGRDATRLLMRRALLAACREEHSSARCRVPRCAERSRVTHRAWSSRTWQL